MLNLDGNFYSSVKKSLFLVAPKSRQLWPLLDLTELVSKVGLNWALTFIVVNIVFIQFKGNHDLTCLKYAQQVGFFKPQKNEVEPPNFAFLF